MDIIFVIFAGLVQGLTEFLPISSTGHLIILEKIFGMSPEKFGLAFDASLHLGTLLAIFTFFYKDYLTVFNLKNRLLFKLIIGTIPAVIFGLLFENYIESSFRHLNIVALSLIGFSFVIYIAEKLGKKTEHEHNISPIKALVIGIFQSIALIPGVSRSGATISAGLLLGQTRDSAARFAFMLSGPIVAGAGLKKFSGIFSTDSGVGNSQQLLFLLGMLSSFFFGYLTIKYFLKFISHNSLTPFIVYRVALGVILLLFSSGLI